MLSFYTPPHNSNGVLCFYVRVSVPPSVRPSACPSFNVWFPLSNLNSFDGILRLLMGKFRQFLTELSARHTFVFRFRTITKGMRIDIVEICFGIANRQILSIFESVICPPHNSGGVLSLMFLFHLTKGDTFCDLLFVFLHSTAVEATTLPA